MKSILVSFVILSTIGTLAVAAPADAPADADLSKDNAALIRHIKATDPIFSNTLDTCSSEQIVRGKSGAFKYSAECHIRPPIEGDCHFYSVIASGTVDTKAWATVRDIRLRLKCSA